MSSTNEYVYCPNAGCPVAARFGRPAEYRAGTEACSDCGSALGAPKTAESVATTTEEIPLGSAARRPIPVPAMPIDQFTRPMMIVTGIILAVAAAATRGWFGLALGLGGIAFIVQAIRFRDRSADGTVQEFELGLRYLRPGGSWSIAWSDIDAVTLVSRPLPTYVYFYRRQRLTLRIQHRDGRVFAIESLATGFLFPDSAFLTWARRLEADHKNVVPAAVASP